MKPNGTKTYAKQFQWIILWAGLKHYEIGPVRRSALQSLVGRAHKTAGVMEKGKKSGLKWGNPNIRTTSRQLKTICPNEYRGTEPIPAIDIGNFNGLIMPKTNIFAKLELKDRVGDEIDIDLERQNLSKLFDSTLREAGLGYWSGSAHRSGALVFYFMVNDVDTVCQNQNKANMNPSTSPPVVQWVPACIVSQVV